LHPALGNIIASLWEIIEPVLEPEGIELVDIEFKLENGRWVLRLYVDVETGISLDECELVSRQVSALLDIKDPIEHKYHLEVSSPGINRILRKEKDFCRFAGSRVKMRTGKKVDGRRNFAGQLLGVEDSKVVVEVDGQKMAIPLEDLEKAHLDLADEDLFRRDLRRGPVAVGDRKWK
jgi:ribosome maturation factor RimP